MLDLTEFEHQLKFIASDVPLMKSFKARNPDLIELFRQFTVEEPQCKAKPLPPTTEMTAVQVTIFDNGEPKRDKWRKASKAARYKAQFEVWTAQNVNTAKVGDYQIKVTAALLTPDDLISRLDSTWKNPKFVTKVISPEFEAVLRNICDQASENDLIGRLHANPKGDGTVYLDQFVIIQGGLKGELTDMKIVVDPENFDVMAMPKFSTTTPNGRTSLAGKAILQSRKAMITLDNAWWQTDEH